MEEKKFATTSAFSNTQNLSLLSMAKTMMKTFTPELVEEITRRIVAELEPEEIIIFGSYAWGTPSKYSDLDLFIIVTDTPDFDRIEWGVRAGSSLDGLMVDVDIWVTTRSHVERWRQVRGSLERKIVQEGKVLYARGKTQVGTVKRQTQDSYIAVSTNQAFPVFERSQQGSCGKKSVALV